MTAQQLVDLKETDAGLEISIIDDKLCPDCELPGGRHGEYCEHANCSEEEQKIHGCGLRHGQCEERIEILDLVEEAEEKEWHADRLLAEILEQNICNSEWELVPERDYLALGCLTSAPILSQEIERDDRGDEIIKAGRVYWFARYEVFDPVEELLEHGKVVFDKGWQEE